MTVRVVKVVISALQPHTPAHNHH